MTLHRRRILLSLALTRAALIAALLVIPWAVTARPVYGGVLLTWDAPTEDAGSVTGSSGSM